MTEFRALLAGGGEMGARISAFDWAATPLGPPRDWPQSLRSALSICLNSSYPSSIYWGPEFRLLYNDAWIAIVGARHPAALGQPGERIWADIWDVLGPQLRAVAKTGEGFRTTDQLLEMERANRIEESYFDYSMTPIAGEDGAVVGILNQGQEVTERVFAGRRDRLLLALNDRVRPLEARVEILEAATALLGEHLGVGRVGYGVVDDANGAVEVEACWTDGTMPAVGGTLRFGTFGDDLHTAMAAGEAFRVDDCRIDPRTAGDRVTALYDQLKLRAGLVVPLMKRGRYAAIVFAHADAPRAWTEHHVTLLRAAADRIWQEVARARVADALRASEERHRLIFEQAHDIIFTTDLEQTITACNPAAAKALGRPIETIVGSSVADYISRADSVRMKDLLRRKLSDGGTTQYEVEVQSADGHQMRWEINSTLTRDRDGKLIGLHAVARDITARHAFEERQALLIHELNHRVKNSLALVQGLALQSFPADRDPAVGRQAFQARLGALAAAHDLLTREKWEGTTLGRLAREAVGAPSGDRILVNGPEVMVPPKMAVSLVMALNELTTNAVKYGALSVPEGTVTLDWTAAGGRLAIVWRERGGPPASPPARRGFGLRLIQRVLASELGGTVDIAFPREGLVCAIEAALPLRAAA